MTTFERTKRMMRTIVINTGTELLLGDVLNTHLNFIAQEIFPLGLRIDSQIAVPDGPAIRDALSGIISPRRTHFRDGRAGPDHRRYHA